MKLTGSTSLTGSNKNIYNTGYTTKTHIIHAVCVFWDDRGEREWIHKIK